MRYHEFMAELENVLLYEMFHIPYYGKIDSFEDFPFRLRTITIGEKESIIQCSIFKYFDAYPFYKEGVLKGWGDTLIYVWAAWKMIECFLGMSDNGVFAKYEDMYDSKGIETLNGLLKDYRDLFDELLEQNKLCKSYDDGIMKVIKQV